jgi:hypothetical protein
MHEDKVFYRVITASIGGVMKAWSYGNMARNQCGQGKPMGV